MDYVIKKGRLPHALATLLIPALFILLRPMAMTLNQSVILGSLFLTIIWWGTGWMHKNFASAFLIVMFIIFGNTPLKQVFYFPLSDSFILVIASFMLSQGIVNSKVADNFSRFILNRYCYNSTRLVVMSFVLGILLIFVIPQPFPRIILLASIYINFLKNTEIEDENQKVLIFSVFVASTVTSLMFLNGDVIINYSAMKFGNISLSYLEWAKYMVVPTLLTSLLIMGAFIRVFRDNLKDRFEFAATEKLSFSREGKIALSITLLIIVLWLTESLHHISSANVALIGMALMFLTRSIGLRDFRVVNISLLIFLTAEFSIGKVLSASGTAAKLCDFLTQFFPAPDSVFYMAFIVLLIMVLHSIMGSLVTAVSVLVPTLLTITAGAVSPVLIVLLTLASVCFHYILPFHHVSVMIGYGNGYYENRHTLRLGLVLTVITLVSVLFIYLPWWRLMGLS